MPDTSHAAEMGSAASAFLELYELRTEPSLRQARAWFNFEFHPTTSAKVPEYIMQGFHVPRVTRPHSLT